MSEPDTMDCVGGKDSEVLTTRSNDRQASAPVFTSRLAQRKSFAPRHESKENIHTREPPSRLPILSRSPSPDPRSTSTHSTRIPRPSPLQKSASNARRPLSLSQAYKMAEEEEEAARGSPSPAPRSWRARDDHDSQRMRHMLNQPPLQFGRRHSTRQSMSPRSEDGDGRSSAESTTRRSLVSNASEESIERKTKQYEEDRKRMEAVREQQTNARSAFGWGTTEHVQPLTRKTSNRAIDAASPPHRPRSWGQEGSVDTKWLRRAISSPSKEAGAGDVGPSVEEDADNQYLAPTRAFARRDGSYRAPGEVRSATVPPPVTSPSKGFAWQADADFTAGDLQVSDSPRIRTSHGYVSRQRNTKLDEIRHLEIEAELNIPSDRVLVDTDLPAPSPTPSQPRHNETHIAPPTQITKRTNTRIDEIRVRETEQLSRRAQAAAKLDEIREKNSHFRTSSPQVAKGVNHEETKPTLSSRHIDQHFDLGLKDEDAEVIPNTPITIFRAMKDDDVSRAGPSSSHTDDDDPEIEKQPRMSHPSDDSRDLLRRLSRAASSSPFSDDQPSQDQPRETAQPTPVEPARSNSGTGSRKTSVSVNAEMDNGHKPSVGFADNLKRIPSTESATTKRSSMVHSDVDPTDRIEGEMKLFAPLDNYSEKGSIRAPSPDSEDDDEAEKIAGEALSAVLDETPKAKKPDPSSQPTPRVVGAFVDTPVTVKIERTQDIATDIPSADQTKPLPAVAVASFLRERPTRTRKGETSRSVGGNQGLARSTAVSTMQRSRSLPRSKSPLINSSKPPTVKDDLIEIHRQNQIDDSTLDDFAELLASTNLEQPTKPPFDEPWDPASSQDKEQNKQKPVIPQQGDLDAYDRMSKSLTSGLLGIQTAKRGIERLEDQVSHAQPFQRNKLNAQDEKGDTMGETAAADCDLCPKESQSPRVTYVHFPLPRLYHRSPSFQPSLLGFLLLLLGLWLAAESVFCSYYCRPEYCEEKQDCSWTPDDPFFGYALPVKVDQWISGGSGRALSHKLGEEIHDLYADAWDFLTGTVISEVDLHRLEFEQQRQLRRRLRKKGLAKPWQDPPDQKDKVDAWHANIQARERAREARELGYSIEDDESMKADEKVPRWGG